MITDDVDRTKPLTDHNFSMEFNRDIPTYRVFSMWEHELTRLIKHFYPEINFEEILTVKHIIYLIRDLGRRSGTTLGNND